MKPVLINWNHFVLYSYPLLIGVAWGFAYRFSEYLLYRQQQKTKGLALLFGGIFLTSWLGAKILFLLVSVKEDTASYALSSNFWLGGGFVFYGGLLGACIFTIIYSKILNHFAWENVLRVLPALPFAHAIGRVGCFMAGCCFGGVCHLPIAVVMRGEHRHAVQLYEAFGLVLIGVGLIYYIKHFRADANVARIYLLAYAILRFIVEFFRADAVRGVYAYDLSTSQLIALVFVFIVLLQWVLERKIKPQFQ